MLGRIRKILAALMFTLITLLFLDFTGTLHHWLGWMAKVQFLPALLALNLFVVVGLVVFTLIFGRIYCSVICPLGILQDIIARGGKRVKNHRYSYSRGLSWLRYLMLVVMLLALLVGIPAVFTLLEPYSSFGRIVQGLIQPVYELGNNLLAAFSEHIDSYAFYRREVWMRSVQVLLIAAFTLLAIGFLAWRNGRTYCNTICPVGTLLSFFARFSWLKINFDKDKCRGCSLCTRNCKTSCIDYKTHAVDYSRCVVCGNCIDVCKHGALKYDGGRSHRHRQADEPDAGKRSFLLASAALAATALAQEAKKVDGGLAIIEDKVAPTRQTPLTPPGSASARNMARHCTACQLCVSECPNDVLRPSTDWNKLMQPTMSYERGYCRPECSRCSAVCPTGAILNIKPEEKVSIQIGHAVWIKKNCIPLTDGVECGNCARHCPVGAIEMVPLDADDDESPYVPAVNEARCIGCGACENLCPARPFSAIYVEGHEQHHYN